MLDLLNLGGPKLAKARSSSIHGTGLFAKKDIPAGEKIIEYTGEKITKAEGNRRYDEQARKNQIYLFELNSRYDIDGSTKGNIAKYANHSCDPNAETIVEKGEIWLVALEDIGKGEEITFDYNFPLFDYEKRPCKCGSDNCRGWIINRDSYNYLRRKKRAAKKGAKKGTKKGTKKGGKKTAATANQNAPAPRRQATATGTSAVKKSVRKTKTSAKNAAKKSAAKKTARKTPAKKGSKRKQATKVAKKGGKKGGKRSARKARKTTGGKSTKKGTKTTANKSAKKSRGGKKTAKKAAKKTARR